jgi:hypothetical protein
VEAFAEASEPFNEEGTWRVQPKLWDANPHQVFEQKEFIDEFYLCLSKMPQRLADACAPPAPTSNGNSI